MPQHTSFALRFAGQQHVGGLFSAESDHANPFKVTMCRTVTSCVVFPAALTTCLMTKYSPTFLMRLHAGTRSACAFQRTAVDCFLFLADSASESMNLWACDRSAKSFAILHMRTSTKLNTSSSISQSLPFFISDLERFVICKWANGVHCVELTFAPV